MINSKFIRSLIGPILSFVVYVVLRNPINRLASIIWSIVDVKESIWLDFSILFLSACLIVSGWRSKREQYSDFHKGVFLSIFLLILLFWYDSEYVTFLTIFKRWPIWLTLFISYAIGLAVHHLYDIFRQGPADESVGQ